MITIGGLPGTWRDRDRGALPPAAAGASPRDVLEMHLRFALDGAGVDLPLLAEIVRVTAQEEIASIVRRKSTGVFARRLWYLYEWLTGRKLDVPESEGRLRFATVLDPTRQMALRTGTPSGRHRVIDNLPGTARFCPLVRWTPALRAASARNWDARAHEIIAATHPARRPWVATWLQRSDAGSSFVLAGEEAPARRIASWGDAIGQAGARVLTVDELLRLQEIAYRDSPSAVLGIRRSAANSGGARPQDLHSLVGGVIDYAERAVCGAVDSVIAAAALAFGFAAIRPLVTGNGHLHRWLVHHTFDAAGYTLPGFVLPISTAMVRRVEEYRALVRRYPSSRREPADTFRFADMTRHAEFLYRCLEDCIEKDLRSGASLAAVRGR
jgi:Fic/DOC family